jgi:hypothetical protein
MRALALCISWAFVTSNNVQFYSVELKLDTRKVFLKVDASKMAAIAPRPIFVNASCTIEVATIHVGLIAEEFKSQSSQFSPRVSRWAEIGVRRLSVS